MYINKKAPQERHRSVAVVGLRNATFLTVRVVSLFKPFGYDGPRRYVFPGITLLSRSLRPVGAG